MEQQSKEQQSTVSAVSVIVCITGGRNLIVDCESTDTILAMKERAISEIQKEDPAYLPAKSIDIRCIFAGKMLEDDKTLKEYNLEKEEEIFRIRFDPDRMQARLRLEKKKLLQARWLDHDEKKSSHASPEILTSDTASMLYQYELAAYAGDVTAQVHLGRCYERGQGLIADLKKARFYYQAAAAQGNPFGVFYMERLEDPSAHVTATFYDYQLAAEAGNLFAHYYLGRCYETGNGVDRNTSYALYCFRIAIDHHPKARAAYQRLLSTSSTTMRPVSSIPILENVEFKKTDLKKLGGGGQGEVYEDQWHDETVAIKYFSAPISDVQRQIQHLTDAETNHSIYLTQIKALCLTPPCIVLEYVPSKNLATFLKTHSDITWLDRYRLAHDIIQGLAYLHQHGLLHRDLKSANVMVVEWPYLHTKLCDFDSLKKMHAKETGSTIVKVTRNYLDPEFLQSLLDSSESEPRMSYAECHDIYSLGWVLWEIATGKSPLLVHMHKGVIYTRTDEPLMKSIPKECPKDFAQLIRDCWSYPSTSRPLAVELVQRTTTLLQAEQHAFANRPDNKGRTPLMKAICHGKIEKVVMLLECKASVNQADSRGWTPLFWAVQRGKQATGMTEFLLEAKANPAVVGPKQTTSVFQVAEYSACRYKNWSVLHVLFPPPKPHLITSSTVTEESPENIQLEQLLGQRIVGLVDAIAKQLQTNMRGTWDPHTPATLASRVVSACSKGKEVLEAQLKDLELHSIPKQSVPWIRNYLKQHPILYELHQNQDLAWRLKKALGNGQLEDLRQRYGTLPLDEKPKQPDTIQESSSCLIM